MLGGIELLRDGLAVPIGGAKPRLALAVLAAHRGSVVSVDRLCDELWGSNPPADPSAVLQSHLSRLRRVLRPEAEIVARPPGYVLQIPGRHDRRGSFPRCCAQARASASSGPQATVELLESALACWRGSPFEEFAEHDWARFEARCVSTSFISSLRRSFSKHASLSATAHATLVGDLEASS